MISKVSCRRKIFYQLQEKKVNFQISAGQRLCSRGQFACDCDKDIDKILLLMDLKMFMHEDNLEKAWDSLIRNTMAEL